jgi:hypothetical protein
MRPYKKKRELNDWILRKLGKPVIDVLIDPTQIDDCIDEACDRFGEFAGDVGNEKGIILICPELLYYDGTGKPCDPGPTAGKWRKPYIPGISGTTPSGSPATTGATGCAPCPPGENTSIVPVTHNYPILDINGNICPVETNPGPGWCGDGIASTHCFTDQKEYDPEAVGPYWVEGDTQGKPLRPGYVFKTVYDVPTSVIAVHDRLTSGIMGMAGNTEENALFAPAGMLLQAGGSWGMQSAGQYMDNRWGFWMGTGGGFADIVSWYMGMQYIELFRQLFTVKLSVQLNELEHKVIITPPPTNKGVICVEVTHRVADEHMYGHQWVRNYATALAMIQVGVNAGKYDGMTFPGGGRVNSEMYLTRGDAMKEKLETELDDGRFGTPADFFIG